jgi:hypothetical protein
MILAKPMRQHWFLVLLPLLLLIEYGFAQSTDWSTDGVAEAAILIDLCLFIPVLHFLCYRRKLAPRALLIRTTALFLAGIYIASQLVPAEGQMLLESLSPLRPIGLVVLALIEMKVLIELVKLAFSGHASAEELSARSGAPEWVAKLMLLEARFWKWLWSLIRR